VPKPWNRNSISRLPPLTEWIPAEVNAELFEKVYPGVEISSEEEMIEQIKKDAAQSFVDRKR
jgi:hypothetical protein